MSRAVLALVLALASAACSGGSKRVGAKPSWRGGATTTTPATQPTGPITFAPTAEGPKRYNEPVQVAPKSPLGDAVIAAVKDAATKANMPVPVADARLFRACEELAAIVPDGGGIVTYDLIEFALQRNGIIEPSPYLLVTWGSTDAPDTFVDELRPRLAEILAEGATARLGVGTSKRNEDGTGAIVFAMQASGVATNPIPRMLPAGGKHPLEVVVDSRFKDPELLITRGNGTIEEVKIAIGKSGAFKATLDCEKHTGRQQVEIAAHDKQGSTVLANFPVWCGEQPPTSITVDPMHDGNEAVPADEAERRLLALANRDRQKAGLHALLWDDRVMEVSRKHSADMKQTKLVAHISPTTGSAADRVKVAGIKTALVLENVARSYGVGQAHAALMNSPGHRASLLSPLATHVGIGVVLGEEVAGKREMFVTQVFIRVPPKVDPAQAVAHIHELINKVRPVSLNPQLSKIAQELADGLAVGKTRDALWPVIKRKLDTTRGFASIGSSVSAAADVGSLDSKDVIDADTKADDIGVGIAQGGHPQIGDGAIWIVVMTAQRLKK